MRSGRSAIFLIQLVQDVNVLRPLVFMAARDFGFETLLLISAKFNARDVLGIWGGEVEQICRQSGARVEFFDDDWEAHRHLTGQGLLFAASESHLPNHVTTHNIFLHAPPTYLRVTVQHGFECVGFRHSAEHSRAHGPTASFAADIVCAWFGADHLASMAPSQRGKLIVTGPTSVLQMPTGDVQPIGGAQGLVCENLHSVRYGQDPNVKSEFIRAFMEFSRLRAARKRRVALRSHAGGQYFFKNKIKLPPNIAIENAPIYRLDLRQYSYGISAPSSVLIDMLLAKIPTAVWSDDRGSVDANSYEGLTVVSSAQEWEKFARAAEKDPESFLARQQRFLDRSGMPVQPEEVFARFSQLFQSAKRTEVRSPGSVAERERILFIANDRIPTVQLSFERPLAPLVRRGEFATRLLTEQHLRSVTHIRENAQREAAWINDYLDSFNPSVILFCRYSGPAYGPMLDWARREEVPVIYHIDDDLLGVPQDIGDRKFAAHNAPKRIAAVTDLLTSADLVYASTPRLRERMLGYFPQLRIVAGGIYSSGSILREPRGRPALTVGYMASADHAHNLAMVMPAIERLLDLHPSLRFELFGSIPAPEQLRRFGNRIATTPAVASYDAFLTEFAKREWDIGICPLAPIDFNLVKTNTKWVEYTSAGVAVVASRGTAYDECCADGCGILADGIEEWFSALDRLVMNVDERVATIERAQAKLQREYGMGRLRQQVLDVVAEAHDAVRARGEPVKKDVSVCLAR